MNSYFENSALMKSMNIKFILIGLALIVAAWGGIALRPTQHIVVMGSRLNLETMIPRQLSDWQIDESIMPLQADPERAAVIKSTYSQTLSRTYVNNKGERIMLSIAYGGDQSESMRVHLPEICYVVQGFQLLESITGNLDTGYGVVPVKRMLAKMSSRLEPITYWVTVGDKVAVDGFKWKLAQLKYGLTGKVPDGMIFRVSSLGEPINEYPMQAAFIKTLLKSLTPENRTRLMGNTTF